MGKVHYVDKPYWPHNTCLYVTDFLGNNPRFAYYLLQTLDFTGYNSGSAQPSLNRNYIYEMRVLVPDRAEQDRIAEILGLIDDRIALVQRHAVALEEVVHAVFKSWFVNFDPVRAKAEDREPEGVDSETSRLFPASFQESVLGSIPEGWRVDSIGNVISCVGGSTPSTKEPAYWSPEEYHWVTPKDLSGQSSPVLLTTERMISGAGLSKISSGLLPAGALLLSSRAPIGYLAIARIPTAVNQGFIAIPPGGELSPEYMLFWLKHNLDTVKQNANGSTFMEISKSSFRKIKLVIPPAQLVNRFTEIARTLLDKITVNELCCQRLTSLRDTLLPRLISGKLRIPEAEEALKEAL